MFKQALGYCRLAMHDLICDANYCAWPAKLLYGSWSV